MAYSGGNINYFLSIGEDLKLWDVNSTKQQISAHRLPGISHVPEAVFSPRGDCIAAVGHSETSSSIYLIDVAKKGFTGSPSVDIFQPVPDPATKNSPSVEKKNLHAHVAFSNSGAFIAATADRTHIDFFNRRTLKVNRITPQADGNLTALLFNHDDSLIISGDYAGNISTALTTAGEGLGVCSFNTEKQAVMKLRSVPFSSITVCSTHRCGAVCLSDIAVKEVIRTFEEHLSECKDIAFSPVSPAMAISVGLDNRIVFYDMREKKKLRCITVDFSLTSLMFLPIGSELVCGTSTGKLVHYDLRNFDSPMKVQAHSSAVTGLVLQPDRKERLGVPDSTLNTTGYVVNPKKRSPGIERRPDIPHGTGSEPSSTSGPATESKLNRTTSIPKSKSMTRPVPATTAKFSSNSASTRVSDPPGPQIGRPTPSFPPQPPPPSLTLPKITECGQGDGIFAVPVVPPLRPVLMDVNSSRDTKSEGKENSFFIAHQPAGADTERTLCDVSSLKLDAIVEAFSSVVKDEVVIENRISCLDVQDVVHSYGSGINEHLFTLEDEVKALREEVRGNTTLLQNIMTELRLLKNHMPY